MTKDNEFDLSIIVVTYNSAKEKVILTLESILRQRNINIEIIIADDGSIDNHFYSIEEFFSEKHFSNYILVGNTVNKGTVANLYSGLSAANGEYVKVISPGDMIYSEDTLFSWINYLKSNILEWSFSNVINYQMVDGYTTPIEVIAHPNNIYVYKHGGSDSIRWQYYVLSDIAVGASILSRRDVQLRYCKEILGKVIYAEDNIWRMMMFDGIVGGFYNQYTVLYEYGTGVSTSDNGIWEEKIKKDWLKTDTILLAREKLDSFQVKMREAYYINRGCSKIKKIFVKGKIIDVLMSRKRKSIKYLP